ncbi:MAG: DNA-processing protein DprA, partial [Polyangiaceae bacterium]
VAGVLDPDALKVAIVGTREAHPDMVLFASSLAAACVTAGAIVVSGGAVGIDAAAHRGAIAAGGRTWAVAPTGREHVFPALHAELYQQVVDSGGALLWPFPPDTEPRNTFHRRNEILVALADIVVVVQAGAPSGALNAAKWAVQFKRPLWAAPSPPWIESPGCWGLLDSGGARSLRSILSFLKGIGLGPKLEGAPVSPGSAQLALLPSSVKVAPRDYSEPEAAVLAVLGTQSIHVDELVVLTALSTSAAVTALLTLSLEHVLVEGPGGFFRRP